MVGEVKANTDLVGVEDKDKIELLGLLRRRLFPHEMARANDLLENIEEIAKIQGVVGVFAGIKEMSNERENLSSMGRHD